MGIKLNQMADMLKPKAWFKGPIEPPDSSFLSMKE